MASAAQTDEPAHFPNTPGLRAGQVLAGRYSIQRVIGSGGMATIVEATHLELGSRVAIKVLHTTHTTSEAIDRFLREARAIFPLRSENVCRVLDLGRLPDGAPFIVMEYLDGTDFASGFRNKQVSPSQAAAYVAQACKGLTEAHALGIVHRDIKPANLFLTKRSDGTELVKVLDFGISKLRREGDESITAEGQVLGTPRYMAPEQFGGATTADARADVWALGLVSYRLVAGHLPYTATTVADIYAELVNQAPKDIRDAVPGIDPSLAAIVMRCLEREPKKRFANARELGAALERFVNGAPDAMPAIAPADESPTLAEPPPRNRGAQIALMAAGALALIGTLGYFATRKTTAPIHPPVIVEKIVPAESTSAPPAASSSEPTTPPPPPSTTVTPHTPKCNPPYFFDQHHNKVFRRECL